MAVCMWLFLVVTAAAPLTGLPGAAATGVQITPEKHMDVTEGAGLAVTCSIEAEHDVEWFGPKGQPITSKLDSRTNVIERKEQSEKQLTLIFKNVQKSDDGVYVCRTKAKGVSPQSATFNLTVIVPVSFQTNESQKTAIEHNHVELSCSAAGNPAPEVTWTRDGIILPPEGGSTKYEKLPHGLRIRNVTREDAGSYQCRAIQYTSQNMEVKVFDINLVVQHKPEWHVDYADDTEVFGYVGGMANLTCVAEVQPALKITWFWNKKKVSPGKNVTIYGDGHNSTLQLNLTDTSLFAAYTCQAKNMLGIKDRVVILTQAERAPRPVAPAPAGPASADHALLRVPGPPPPPADADAKAKAGQAPRRLEVTGLRLLVRPAHSRTRDQPRIVDMPWNADGEYKLLDLAPSTHYIVRAQWHNSAGFSEPSDAVEIHTSDAEKNASRTVSPPAIISALAILSAVAILSS